MAYETTEWRHNRTQEWVRGRPTGEIANIIAALSSLTYLNTDEEWERLRVAKDELRKRVQAKRAEKKARGKEQ